MDNGRAVLDSDSGFNGGAMASRRDPASYSQPGQPPQPTTNRPVRGGRFRRIIRAVIITCLILAIGFVLGLILGAISGVL
jgi:hypothetical protein